MLTATSWLKFPTGRTESKSCWNIDAGRSKKLAAILGQLEFGSFNGAGIMLSESTVPPHTKRAIADLFVQIGNIKSEVNRGGDIDTEATFAKVCNEM